MPNAAELSYREAFVAYNPNSNEIKVGPLLREYDVDWSKPYLFTVGGCYDSTRAAKEADVMVHALRDFMILVVRDGVDVPAAYREFSKVREFRLTFPEDMPEATQ
jgi:hypothetical protein